MKNKLCAFSLAEVLITIVVIGIVAAITVPGLITKYQKYKTVKSLQHSYVLLSQAVELAKLDYDDTDSWDFSIGSAAFRDKYLLPYFKSTSPAKYDVAYKQWPRWSDGMKEGGILAGDMISNCFQTAQGYMYCVRTYYREILIDINGYKSGPNRVGRDIFLVVFDKHGKKGLGMYEYERNISRHCSKTGGNGSACGLKIKRDGWRIKDDYPWF